MLNKKLISQNLTDEYRYSTLKESIRQYALGIFGQTHLVPKRLVLRFQHAAKNQYRLAKGIYGKQAKHLCECILGTLYYITTFRRVLQ